MPKQSKTPAAAGTVRLRRKRLASGAESLYLDIYRGQGVPRQYEFLKLYLTGHRAHDEEALRWAELKRSERELELRGKRIGLVPAHVRRASFLDYMEAVGSDPKRGHDTDTWNNVLTHLRAFAPVLTFDQVTPERLAEFRGYLLDHIAASSTVTYLAALKAACRAAVKEGKIDRDPTLGLESVKVRQKPTVYLTIEELRKLESTPADDPEVKRAFLFACFTGLRRSDVVALEWDHVEDSLGGARLAIVQQKTGDVVYLPLSEQAHSLLGDRSESDSTTSPVFALPSFTKIARVLKRWAVAAGVSKRVTFHVSRHTFATLALRHGGDLFTVSKLLGHTNITSTQRYAQVVDEMKRSAVEAIPTL